MKILNKEMNVMKIGHLKNKVLALSMMAASLMLASVSASAWTGHNDHHSHNYYEQRHNHHQQVKQHIKERVQYRAAQRRVAYHQWRRGEYLPVAYHSPRYVVSDWRAYRLSAPPRGHEWLRVNGRFVQVSVSNHRISRIW